MIDILETVLEWSRSEEQAPVYAATVTDIEGSAVRGIGATIALSADGKVVGSVSGGCIEPTLLKEAPRLRGVGRGEKKVFCPTDDDIFGAPSPCGGTVSTVVYPLDPGVLRALERAKKAGLRGCWAVVTEGPARQVGTTCALDDQGSFFISACPDGSAAPSDLAGAAQELLRGDARGELEVSGARNGGSGDEGERESDWRIFVRREPPVPRLVIMGGSHIGEALSRLMRSLGWRSIVIDPRDAFSQSWRFSHADMLLHEWPQEAFEELKVGEGDAVAAVTHNEQMDDEAVAQALGRRCYYVGVLGGRGTQRDRRARLKERGFSDEQLGRIHGPIGLDIGAAVPEEIALSVAAEVVAEYRKLPHTEERA